MDRRGLLTGAFAALAACANLASAAPQPELTVFATGSLNKGMERIVNRYARETGQGVRLQFGTSSALARQIESGSQADVFLSADPEWMDYLEKRQLINAATRRNLLLNRLALIAPGKSDTKLAIAPKFPLVAALGKDGRLATAEPDQVPAGRYARYALISLGVWNAVGDHLMRTDSVRDALSSVSSGAAPLGIVYETEALQDKGVRIVDLFPATSHPPIAYPIASTPSAQAGTSRFMGFLRDAGSRDIFAEYGYRLAP